MIFGVTRLSGIILDILLYVLVYLLLLNSWRFKHISASRFRLSIVLFLIFCIIPFFAGDFFHYAEYMKIMKNSPSSVVNLEEFYLSIASFFDWNYAVWRLVIWGAAICCLLFITKLLKINKALFIFVFFSCFIAKFSYARVSLAMCLVFLGMSILIRSLNKRNNKLNYILGALALLASIYLHKTAIYGVAIGCLSLLCRSLTKNRLLIIIAVVPLIVSSMSIFLNDIVGLSAHDKSFFDIETAQTYLKADTNKEMGVAQLISNILNRVPYYVIGYLIFIEIINNRFSQWPTGMKVFSVSTLFILVSASIFLLDFNGLSTYIIYYRFLNFIIIPCAVFISYYHRYHPKSKLLIFSVYILMLGQFYDLIYSLYCEIVDPLII